MLPGKTLSPQDILSALKRRRWLILLPFAVGLALVPMIAKYVPEVYRSETLIMVIPQRVPDTYVKSTITGTVEDRLPSISDQIMSRSRLERIINDFDLYRDMRSTVPMEDVVQRMRSDIGPPEIREGEQSFRVAYVNADPVIAQKVTARLASLFIEENSNERENLAQSTNVFLESQLQDSKQRLVEHEHKLEAFRRSYSGELPTQLESNLRAISSTQLLLQSNNEAINRASERRLLVERQLADARSLPAVTPPVPLTSGQQEAALSPAQQLEAVAARLEQMKLRFKPDHPDVRALERIYRDLQPKVAADGASDPGAAAAKPLSREEQDRQKRINDLEAEIEVIDHQLAVSRAEDVRLKGTLTDYQRKVEAVPGRESELVELTRDYEVLKKTYDSLLVKWEDSKLAANLERRQIGEQFRILDPASLPERASNQGRRLAIVFSAAGIGFILGLAFAMFLELKDSSLHREEDVTQSLSLPVLALVPAMVMDRDKRQKRRRQLAFDVVASTVLAASVVFVAVWGVAQI
jgi:polysaccharide chain length determinant protein (PEP-CTERM system associated)